MVCRTQNCKMADLDVHETLGTGTFGRVRLVQYKETNKYYALKVLKKQEVVRLKQLEHVMNEKRVLAQISHPFIVHMEAAFQDSRNLYMLLELVIGGELFSHLRKAGRFSNETSRKYAAMIVLALNHLHDRGIVYRDLKPENLLLDEKGYVKIADFGRSPNPALRTLCPPRARPLTRCAPPPAAASPRWWRTGRGRCAGHPSTSRPRLSSPRGTAPPSTGHAASLPPY